MISDREALKTSLEAAQCTRLVLGAVLFTNGDEKKKNLDKRRSSSLAGMFSIALDSFCDSQNFFQAFKSLLVLYWVFLDFCSCKTFSISTSSLLVAYSAGLNLPRLLVFFTCFVVKVYWFFHLLSLVGTSQFKYFVCEFFRTTVTTKSV